MYFDQLTSEVQKTSAASNVFVDALYHKLASKDIKDGKLLPSETSAERLKKTYGEVLTGNSVWSMLEEKIKNPPQASDTSSTTTLQKDAVEMMDDKNAIRKILLKYNKFPHPEKLDQLHDERTIQSYVSTFEKLEDGLGTEVKPTSKKCSLDARKKLVSLVLEVFSLYGTGKVGEAYVLWEKKEEKKAKEQANLAKNVIIPLPKSTHVSKPSNPKTTTTKNPISTSSASSPSPTTKSPEWKPDLLLTKIKKSDRSSNDPILQDDFADLARFWRKTGVWVLCDNSGNRNFKGRVEYEEMASLINQFVKKLPQFHLQFIPRRKLPSDTNINEFKLNSERIQAYLSGFNDYMSISTTLPPQK